MFFLFAGVEPRGLNGPGAGPRVSHIRSEAQPKVAICANAAELQLQVCQVGAKNFFTGLQRLQSG